MVGLPALLVKSDCSIQQINLKQLMNKLGHPQILASLEKIGVIFLMAGLCASACGADYLGAEAVLQQVADRVAKPADKNPPDEQSRLRSDLKVFSQNVTNLAATEAAGQWLKLVDRAIKIQQAAGRDYNPTATPLGLEDLLNALPPPSAWAELAKAVAARPTAKDGGPVNEIGLRLLAAYC